MIDCFVQTAQSAAAVATTPHYAEYLQTAAAVAQVVIAVIALFFAYKAARAPRDTVFLQAAVAELADTTNKAREVRRLYLGLFKEFKDKDAKELARAVWLEKREDVSSCLHEQCEILRELEPVRDAWLAVEREEDTHVRTDALKLTDPKAINDATRRYDETHRAFLAKLGATMKTLR